MSEQLARLMTPPTKEELRDKLLGQLAGRGWTYHLGSSPGSVTTSGVPTVNVTARVVIMSTGDLGSGTFSYSIDGGATWVGPNTIPSNGTFAGSFAASTGCSLVFANGVAGTPPGQSFLVNDQYQMTLATGGFPVTAWQPLSVPRSMVENDAEALADLYQLIKLIAQGGFASTAIGDWLDIVAEQVYGLTRNKGIPAKGTVRLVDAGSTGPYTQTAGAVIVSTSSGLRFINDAGFTLALGGTQNLAFTAEKPGSQYNVGNGVIGTLVSPAMPSVVVSNPDPGSGTWITQAGSDDETDAQLAARCLARWPQLGTGSPTSTYDAFAKAADTSVTKTASFVDQTVPGQVDLYLAGSAGPVGGGVVTNVQNYVNPRVPITVTVLAASAVGHSVTITGTVYILAPLLQQAEGEINANLTALFGRTPIGGTIYLSDIIRCIQDATGVRNVALTAPVADTALTPTQVATLTNSLTYAAI